MVSKLVAAIMLARPYSVWNTMVCGGVYLVLAQFYCVHYEMEVGFRDRSG